MSFPLLALALATDCFSPHLHKAPIYYPWENTASEDLVLPCLALPFSNLLPPSRELSFSSGERADPLFHPNSHPLRCCRRLLVRGIHTFWRGVCVSSPNSPDILTTVFLACRTGLSGSSWKLSNGWSCVCICMKNRFGVGREVVELPPLYTLQITCSSLLNKYALLLGRERSWYHLESPLQKVMTHRHWKKQPVSFLSLCNPDFFFQLTSRRAFFQHQRPQVLFLTSNSLEISASLN